MNGSMWEVEEMVGKYRSKTWFRKGRYCSVFSLGHMEFEDIIYSTDI